MPTVLIADDDPVSLSFLRTATASLGCNAIVAASGASALKLADANAVDLLLLDLHMPDIGGPALLHALRARGMHAAAIATSAGFDRTAVASLLACGFAGTLEKPASLETIEAVLRQHLGLGAGVLPSTFADASSVASPVVDDTILDHTLLDDSSALAAIGGDRDAMRALRRLFAQELEVLDRDFQDAPPDSRALSERLHRLRASSGFCGATALANAALRLQQALDRDAEHDALADFLRTCGATRRALAAQR